VIPLVAFARQLGLHEDLRGHSPNQQKLMIRMATARLPKDAAARILTFDATLISFNRPLTT
jgi:hypothetical protein